jgi:TRAP-type C4-dicarboxylate transport system, small permease component
VSERPVSSVVRSLDRATRFLSALAGISLIFMMAIIAINVVTRYLLNSPMTGAEEIVQMTGIAVIMLALPYATHQGAHVRVDIFDYALGHFGRMAGDVLARLLTGGVLAVVVHKAWAKMLDAHEFGDTTNMLGLPVWPFYGILAAGLALCVLVYAVELVLIISGKQEQ